MPPSPAIRLAFSHTIAGEPVPDHLSFLFRSLYEFDGHLCEDAKTGCE